MFSRSARLRPLRASGLQGAFDLALRDPVTHALAGARLQDIRRSLSLGQEFAVIGPDAAPDAVLWHGVNLSPIGTTTPAIRTFGRFAAERPRRASSVVGDRAGVEVLWKELVAPWGAQVRQYRWSQPVMVAGEAGVDASAPRSGLRPARKGEEDLVFPAAVSMFREEVGTDPTVYDGGRGYRARVRDLVYRKRTYIVMSEGRVIFKADVGALFGPVAQIHGVWTHPDWRGLVAQVRRDHAPQVSLYVNDYNTAARHAYAAAGFTQVGELATILF
jgi:hypothetical protein